MLDTVFITLDNAGESEHFAMFWASWQSLLRLNSLPSTRVDRVSPESHADPVTSPAIDTENALAGAQRRRGVSTRRALRRVITVWCSQRVIGTSIASTAWCTARCTARSCKRPAVSLDGTLTLVGPATGGHLVGGIGGKCAADPFSGTSAMSISVSVSPG